jgi:steroid 5-alpha reductase family enzyme
MREKWKTNINLKFFLFFQVQTVLVVLLSLPFLMMIRNPAPRLSGLEIAGSFVWLAGLIGESVADAQLKKFKNNPLNKGKTCRVGLWNYSRHPNYFFESIIWIGYAIAALTSSFGWVGLLSAAGMWYILNHVTGVPLTEEHALRTRGEEYRSYQQTTSRFIPWKKSP